MKKSCKEDKVAYTFFSSFFPPVKTECCHIPTHPSLKSGWEYHVSEFDREQPLNQKYAQRVRSVRGNAIMHPSGRFIFPVIEHIFNKSLAAEEGHWCSYSQRSANRTNRLQCHSLWLRRGLEAELISSDRHSMICVNVRSIPPLSEGKAKGKCNDG